VSRQKASKVEPFCPNCGTALIPGIAHRCPIAGNSNGNGNGNGNGSAPDALRGFLLKLLIPIIMLMITELIGGIWWAATIQTGQVTQQEQLRDLRQKVDQIESYFRRPIPQSYTPRRIDYPRLITASFPPPEDPRAQQITQAARRRVIPSDVINRFMLRPATNPFGPFVLGQDSMPYDLDDVLATLFELTREHWQLRK
jgi:hypothetical protein